MYITFRVDVILHKILASDAPSNRYSSGLVCHRKLQHHLQCMMAVLRKKNNRPCRLQSNCTPAETLLTCCRYCEFRWTKPQKIEFNRLTLNKIPSEPTGSLKNVFSVLYSCLNFWGRDFEPFFWCRSLFNPTSRNPVRVSCLLHRE